jgi:hypothetical protein
VYSLAVPVITLWSRLIMRKFAVVPFVLTSLTLSYGTACSGTKVAAVIATDAGPDVSTVDARVIVDAQTPPPPACRDASVDDLNIPDASLGDAGQNTGACFDCLKADCGGALIACNNNCDCRGAIVSFLECAPTAADQAAAQACAFNAFGSVSGQASGLGQTLGLCAVQKCRASCVPDTPRDAGSDANDGSDAGDASDAEAGM